MSHFRGYLKPLMGVALLVGLGMSLSGCLIVTPHHPRFCYYHPYNPGC